MLFRGPYPVMDLHATLLPPCIAISSFLVARFSRRLPSNCSLLKATSPARLPDKVPIGPSVWFWGSTGSCTPHHLYELLPCMGPSMRIGPWAVSPSYGLGNKAMLCHSPNGPQTWPGGRIEFSSGHWPVSGVDGHNYGCPIDGPLNLPRDRL
jgi:hypothetical protein